MEEGRVHREEGVMEAEGRREARGSSEFAGEEDGGRRVFGEE
jgi:hypothetical protein